jgi:hypothetical protein
MNTGFPLFPTFTGPRSSAVFSAASEGLEVWERAAVKIVGGNRQPGEGGKEAVREYRPGDLDDCLSLFNGWQGRIDLARVWERDELGWELAYPDVSQTLVYEKDGLRLSRGSISKYAIFMIGVGCRPEAPVAERGPVGFSDGGNRRDWFPGVQGPRAASYAEWNHINGDAYLSHSKFDKETLFV